MNTKQLCNIEIKRRLKLAGYRKSFLKQTWKHGDVVIMYKDDNWYVNGKRVNDITLLNNIPESGSISKEDIGKVLSLELYYYDHVSSSTNRNELINYIKTHWND